jgi:hypothetical protein
LKLTDSELQPNKWVSPKSSIANKAISQALLFEYLPDLTPLTKDMVTKQLSEDVQQALSELHALNILHGDFDELNAYPDIGFRNIFVYKIARPSEKSQCSRFYFVYNFSRKPANTEL